MLNLLQDPWIPVRRRDGSTLRIAPHQITEHLGTNPVVDLAPFRPDFKGALFQFLVGLLQSTRQPPSDAEWYREMREPPGPELLQQSWAHLRPFFELGGEGPRVFQDLDPLLEGSQVQIANLLIDAPGEKTQDDHTDHFTKGGVVESACPGCAAQALLTLQINAPSGGAGHRTSLRGGGPLSTVVLPATLDGTPLWEHLWLNVLSRSEWPLPEKAGSPEHWLPWVRPTRTSEKNETTTPADAHPLLAYWATPRRIRLALEKLGSGPCDICGKFSPMLVSSYRTRPRGANYVQWQHPLSPHRKSKPADDWLPVHPQPGGLGYRHWPAMVASSELSKPALVVEAPFNPGSQRQRYAKKAALGLWAFGYDLDNMKARSYQERTMPLLEAGTPETQKTLGARGHALVEAATAARDVLRGSIKDAWLGDRVEARGDFSFAEVDFWARGEVLFFDLLRALARGLAEGQPDETLRQALAESWQTHLLKLSLDLFDHWVLSGALEQGNPRRIAEARNRMEGYLRSPRFIGLLGGVVPERPKPTRPKKGAKA